MKLAPSVLHLSLLGCLALALVRCAGSAALPLPPRPDRPLQRPPTRPAPVTTAPVTVAPPADAGPPPVAETNAGIAPAADAGAPDPAAPDQHCAGVPPLNADGGVPPAPPHTPLGVDMDVPGDRPVYLLPGNSGDPRVIVYLHGMCGDVAAADYFREAARAHGTVLALRGDKHCAGDRFKWRDDPSKILTRLRAALKHVNAVNGIELNLDGALLFGYSQGADRAEKLSAEYPKIFPRVVLGGPPMRASPIKLARAARVAILGGELESTDTMHAGADALTAAGISCRFFTLECAYHGYYGIRAEAQLLEVLDWVRAP